jgi:hypothetical protein
MAARSNAASELTRLWLEHRLGCLVREGLQVPVDVWKARPSRATRTETKARIEVVPASSRLVVAPC